MNFAALALRISNATERFPHFHKMARRLYCAFRPGIRFQTEAVFKDYEDIFVLKIGAYDGIDSLATLLLTDARYRGLLVDPIPMSAAKLRANYGTCGRFTIVQAAVAASSGTANMYYVDESALKLIEAANPAAYWLRAVASLDRLHVLKHLAPEMHAAVKETPVECLTVNALLSRNNIQKIDLLHIDAEGFDYVILRQFDFTTLHPRIVLFEHKHLTNQDRRAAKTMMELAGYKVEEMETDFFALAEL